VKVKRKIVAVPALAAETSRAEYVAVVEPICHRNTQANERILKGVKSEVKRGKLKPAAALAKAAAALQKTYAELKAVPQPAADAARLATWLTYVKSESTLLNATAKELRAGNKSKASHEEAKLVHNANLANSEVRPFGFHCCRFEPARFT